MNESHSQKTNRDKSTFELFVGAIALSAPALHTMTDVLEWLQGGFSDIQLLLNYLAFLPMTWLLIGLYAVYKRRIGVAGLVGAIFYGAAFTYFSYTTLFALTRSIPTYEALWAELGATYTFHGGLMILGGTMFGWTILRAKCLPKWTGWVFLFGLAINLLLALLPAAPEILQTVGSTVRNIGLMGMGYAILFTTQPPEQ